MLNICILVKPVMDSNSIQWDYQKQRFSFISNTFNSADLHALQWACDYKKKYGAVITVLLATDPDISVDENSLLKYNLDECLIIQQPGLRENRNEAARILASELKGKSGLFDVIISGSVSEDENLGVTPFMIAESLGIPSITNIQHIEVIDDRVWRVKRGEGRGIVQTYEIRLPALIGVVSSLGRKRYIPRYSRSMANQKKARQQIQKGPSNHSKVKVIKVSEPKPNIRYFGIPDDHLTPELRLLQIMGLNRERTENTGEKVASEITDRNIHFISQKLQKWLKEE
ncbi:electron transfer flavoprotein subunit beta/FixA family protein [Neobacillus sp. KR4-4]|uniref:electron transfer flavoprotein subunit beta/FixA family protein n=1 Tax=Neobacillus sp. KR4-4 TaxID=3344872 RepID=UPI0035C98A70